MTLVMLMIAPGIQGLHRGHDLLPCLEASCPLPQVIGAERLKLVARSVVSTVSNPSSPEVLLWVIQRFEV